jgi:hypothetical protein
MERAERAFRGDVEHLKRNKLHLWHKYQGSQSSRVRRNVYRRLLTNRINEEWAYWVNCFNNLLIWAVFCGLGTSYIYACVRVNARVCVSKLKRNICKYNLTISPFFWFRFKWSLLYPLPDFFRRSSLQHFCQAGNAESSVGRTFLAVSIPQNHLSLFIDIVRLVFITLSYLISTYMLMLLHQWFPPFFLLWVTYNIYAEPSKQRLLNVYI